jgi:hypothetical protein
MGTSGDGRGLGERVRGGCRRERVGRAVGVAAPPEMGTSGDGQGLGVRVMWSASGGAVEASKRSRQAGTSGDGPASSSGGKRLVFESFVSLATGRCGWWSAGACGACRWASDRCDDEAVEPGRQRAVARAGVRGVAVSGSSRLTGTSGDGAASSSRLGVGRSSSVAGSCVGACGVGTSGDRAFVRHLRRWACGARRR